MITADVLQQKLAALPGPVQDYLYSEQAGELNEKIITRNSLPETQEPTLFGLLKELFVKEVPLPRLLDEVKGRFGLDEAKSKKLAADIAGFRLLPLDKWLGDVDGYVRSLGADSSSYPKMRVQIERRTPEQAAEDVVRESDVSVSDARAQARLKNVVESFLAGVRTEEQVQDVMARPEKIGGLGLDQDETKRVMEEMREETQSVIIDAAPPQTIPGAPAAPSSPAAPLEKKKEDFSTIKPEDEAEIEKFKKVVLPKKDVSQAEETARRIEASVDEIYLASGFKAPDEKIEKRAKTVIANRLRDVRDQMETLEILVQPKELGGLGLRQDAARALLAAIQSKLKKVHEEHAVQARTEKAEWVMEERRQKTEGEKSEKQAAAADLDDLYQSVISKSKKAVKNAPTAPTPVPDPTAAAIPLAPPPNLPVAVTDPIPPELRTPTPPPPIPAVKPTEPPLTIVRPVPGIAVLPQVQGSLEAPKPRMQDVKPAVRVIGPVEELRSITVVDFRRLSKDPVEACAKIKDKIDVLAAQSYTRRTEAIAAWNASEAVRTYIELMREGLNGVPLKDASSARQAASKPYLSAEEFQAISALSRQLRY